MFHRDNYVIYYANYQKEINYYASYKSSNLNHRKKQSCHRKLRFIVCGIFVSSSDEGCII